ncbi:MAG: signal peptidase I [Kiritimatiellae bacterium]|nr:signal peptidase I [Kiritimatiellia bacterium]
MAATLTITAVFFVVKIQSSHFRVQSMSMSPTFQPNDLLRFDKVPVDQINRFEVILFDPGYSDLVEGDENIFAFRIIGLPTEVISIIDNNIHVNGERIDANSAVSDIEYLPSRDGVSEWTVPENHFFVLGDNPSVAYDSRYIGPVPFDRVQGMVVGVK